jgi:DNA-binding CsgD family transcriptional regulator/PAS domain-containing protein
MSEDHEGYGPGFSQSAAEPLQDWLELVYEGVLEPVPWTLLLERLRLHLQANFVSLAIRSPSADDPGLVVFAGAALSGTQLTYERSFYALDPFVDLPCDRVLMLHECVDEQQWLDSALYSDFLSALDIRHVMGADLRISPGQSSRLRISRGRQGTPFGEPERQLCADLLPHLRHALRIYARLDDLESERRLYASTLQCLNIGTLLLDAQGQVLQCSEVASQLLTGEHGLQLVAGRLHAQAGMDERRLWRAINHVLEARASHSAELVEAVSLSWSGKGLGILLRGLAQKECFECGLPAAVEVILRDPQRQPEPSEILLRQLFQFTPAEAALAAQLCHGQNLEQAAIDLGISRNTARAHLRVIFSKTGTARQASLVQLLLGSVASLHPLAAQKT